LLECGVGDFLLSERLLYNHYHLQQQRELALSLCSALWLLDEHSIHFLLQPHQQLSAVSLCGLHFLALLLQHFSA
jgi:hypothetical protein